MNLGESYWVLKMHHYHCWVLKMHHYHCIRSKTIKLCENNDRFSISPLLWSRRSYFVLCQESWLRTLSHCECQVAITSFSKKLILWGRLLFAILAHDLLLLAFYFDLIFFKVPSAQDPILLIFHNFMQHLQTTHYVRDFPKCRSWER